METLGAQDLSAELSGNSGMGAAVLFIEVTKARPMASTDRTAALHA